MLKKLLFIVALIPTMVVGQHTIKGNFSPAQDYEWAILYKVTPTASSYIANTEVNEQGNFEFVLDSTVTKGMYRIVYAIPQEEHNFDIIYSAREDIELTFNQETGVAYQLSVENNLVSSYTNSMSLISQSIGNFFRQQSSDSLALESIFKTQRETQEEYEKLAKGMIALQFIEANRPYIPDGFEDIKTYVQNLKTHFFDNVDFNNETLQSSTFIIERVLNYVFGMPSEDDDETTTYKKNIETVYLAMEDGAAEIKKTVLQVVWQQMVDGNLDDVANYIADNYLIEVARSLNDSELVNELNLFKSLSVGNKAPEFSFEIDIDGKKITKKLSDLDASDQYVVVFWSSTCSHCLEEVPKLRTYINSLEIGKLQVVAVGLEDEPFRWRNETLKYPEFIHVLGLGKWDNEIANLYNVNSTPTYYVLDKDKNIIAKPYDFEALQKFMTEK